MKDVYPYHAYRRTGGWTKFTNGLMFLSKFEISDVVLEMHAQMAGIERMLGSKAVLAVRVNTPVGQLCLMNMHTTAGGGLNPEAVDAVRESELQEAVDMGNAALGEGYTPIILGDMNMGERRNLLPQPTPVFSILHDIHQPLASHWPATGQTPAPTPFTSTPVLSMLTS